MGFDLAQYVIGWVGFKGISEMVESSGSLVSDPDRIKIIMPDDFEMPPGGLSIRWPDAPLEQERRLHGPKMQAVAALPPPHPLERVLLGTQTAPPRHMGARTDFSDLPLRPLANRGYHPPAH